MNSTLNNGEASGRLFWSVVVWGRVVLASWIGWCMGLIAGFLGLVASDAFLCPEDQRVSGTCTAPWVEGVERGITIGSVALAAVLVVGFASIAAGEYRRARAAHFAFVVGSVCAGFTCFLEADPMLWGLGATAIVAGWVTRVVVLKWVRSDAA